MQNLQEFLLTTKTNEYLIAIVFMFIFIAFWKVLNAPRRLPVREAVAESFEMLKGIFAHPSHTWAEVIQPNLVQVGIDRFASSVFGSVQGIELPRLGDRIYQGAKVWKIKRGGRELEQVSPITGRVVEVNTKLLENPKLLNQGNPEQNWILKIAPTRLAREVRNLLSGEMLSLWNQGVKEQLVATLVPTSYPVLQEGGEIMPHLGDELTSDQWEKVAHNFFNMVASKPV
ncbi:MAG: glycine cleavage system protein H [candidate division Zixibacteria bacterium]|nr:glycine cleavage system protein H [candidate division Zixibacteria bacterium]